MKSTEGFFLLSIDFWEPHSDNPIEVLNSSPYNYYEAKTQKALQLCRSSGNLAGG